jgi:transposase-like protein
LVYPKALRRTYGYDKKNKEFQHKVTKSSDKSFNWKIERLHNSIRQRTKTFRSFHGSIDSANTIMKGVEIHYNFIRKHQGLGKCPYELAVPELKDRLNVSNKWLELINLGSAI